MKFEKKTVPGNRDKQDTSRANNHAPSKKDKHLRNDMPKHNSSFKQFHHSDDFQNEFDRKKISEQEQQNTTEQGMVAGRNAVRELLRSGRDIDKIFVQRGEREGSITVLVAQALERSIPVINVDRRKLDEISDGVPHQGIVAMASMKTYVPIEHILQVAAKRNEPPFIILAENLNDPYNLGALIRCAEGAGAHGLIIPKRHSVGISTAVAKSSAGAVEHLAIAKTTNIAQTIRMLKEHGIWVYAAEAGGTEYYNIDFSVPCALVLGSEGSGISHVVRQACDNVVSIPMYGCVNSFNVATAGAVLMCEVRRKRAMNS